MKCYCLNQTALRHGLGLLTKWRRRASTKLYLSCGARLVSENSRRGQEQHSTIYPTSLPTSKPRTIRIQVRRCTATLTKNKYYLYQQVQGLAQTVVKDEEAEEEAAVMDDGDGKKFVSL